MKAYVTKTNNFKVIKIFKDFESIKKGNIIGIDGNEKIKSLNNGYILFARDRKEKGVEGFIKIKGNVLSKV